jgi:transposase
MLIQYLINVKLLCVASSPRPDEVMIVRYVQPLTDAHRALLEKTMQEDPAFRARSRAHSLVLRAAGTPIQTIAKTSQVHRVTVSAGLTTWERHGAQSVQDHPRSGRPPTLTPDAQELAPHSLKEAPRALTQVVERCANKTGTRLSISSLKRLAKTARLRWTRVRKACKRRREPAACAPCQRAREALQTQADQGTIDLSYFDASGFALEPAMPYAGQEPQSVIELPARQYGRIHVWGCMNRHNDLHASLLAASLHPGVGMACVEAFGHTITKKTGVVIDHASIHPSDDCAERLPSWQKHGWLIKYLSPYSPEGNLIEILWRRITYTWVPFSAYAWLNALSEALETIVSHVGSEYQITFA